MKHASPIMRITRGCLNSPGLARLWAEILVAQVRVKVVFTLMSDVVPLATMVCAPTGPEFIVGMVPEQVAVPLPLAIALHKATAGGFGDARPVLYLNLTCSPGANPSPVNVTGVPLGPEFGVIVTRGWIKT